MAGQKDEKPIEKIAEAASQAARAESESAPVRHYRADLFRLALLVVAAAFGLLTFLAKTMPVFPIDVQITRAIQILNFPPFALLMNLISWPGYGPQAGIIAALIVISIYGFGLHWEAVMALGAAAFSTGVDVLVKDLVQRPRPVPSLVHVFAALTSYSFPSGHVMFYSVFFGFVGFLAFTLLKPSLKRSVLLALLGGLIALIGVSRIYLGEHWASDVLAAYLLGSLTLVASIEFYLWGKTRFFVHQPVAAEEPQQA